jgi:hypothetical protein
MGTERRTAKLVGLPLSLVVAGGVLLSVPVEAAVPTPCNMQVQIDRRSNELYANGVERSVYNVKVSWGDKSQTAVVQRMVMPPSA